MSLRPIGRRFLVLAAAGDMWPADGMFHHPRLPQTAAEPQIGEQHEDGVRMGEQRRPRGSGSGSEAKARGEEVVTALEETGIICVRSRRADGCGFRSGFRRLRGPWRHEVEPKCSVPSRFVAKSVRPGENLSGGLVRAQRNKSNGNRVWEKGQEESGRVEPPTSLGSVHTILRGHQQPSAWRLHQKDCDCVRSFELRRGQ